jgi:hypothetical protein
MMRKVELMVLCLLVLGSTAFTMDLVIGTGGFYGFCMEEYVYPRTEYNFSYKQTNNAITYGGSIFFGISRFMEGSIYVMTGTNERVDKGFNDEIGEYFNDPWDEKDNSYQVGVGLFVKYPFILTKSLVFFPTAGVDLQNNYGGLDLWFRGGIGFDIFLSQRFFLRVQGLYGVGAMMIYRGNNNEYVTAAPSIGPLFKAGIGWMY